MKAAPPVLIAVLAACSLIAGAASAQEIIQAGPKGAPPAAAAPAAPAQVAQLGDPEQSPQAIGAWARGVMDHAGDPHAARASDDRSRRSGCAPPPDRKPHGEVWGGVGTGGYREGGAVVTAPIGNCAQATIMVDSVHGPDFRRH